VLLKPVAIFKDPFRGAPNMLVMCECIEPVGMTPIPSNTRRAAAEAFAAKPEERPWFGLEQEYTLFNADKVTPLGWPVGGYPGPQGPYYCSAGTENSFGRLVVEAHYRACLYAGIKMSGINAEVLPGQWEYQVGPCEGISSGDHCWMARYIMYRVCEDFGVCVSFDPKPISGDWNGSGMHSNYSTEAMRKVRMRLKPAPPRRPRSGPPHRTHPDPNPNPRPHPPPPPPALAGGRLPRHHLGDREAGRQAQGAHRRVRRGQRAPPHRPPRDGQHQPVLLRRGQPRRVHPHPPRRGAREEGLL
jgi:hypothetical protein